MFLGAAQRRLFERGIPVFTYHSVAAASAGTRDPFLFVTPQRLDEQLAALCDAGFTGATLGDIAGARDNRERRFVITFDDGCRNVSDHALEILARHRVRAIEFLVAGMIGGRNEWDVKHGEKPEPLMDATQVRDWLAAGHEIGSHSLTHRNLPRLNSAEAREQIFAAKKKLEDAFGVAVRHFCYPHGRWNEAVAALVAEAGYETACTTQFGVNRADTPCFALRRVFPLGEAEMLAKIAHRLARKFGGAFLKPARG